MFVRIGRHFSQRIGFFCGLIVGPVVLLCCWLLVRGYQISELEAQFSHAERFSRSALEKRACKERFLHTHSRTDPSFLHRLETLELLAEQKKRLQWQMRHPACADRAALQARMQEIERLDNRIQFVQDATRSSKKTYEVDVHLLHPIEVEVQDLERIFSVVEGIAIGSYQPMPEAPQCFFTDLMLTKKQDKLVVDFSMLKREFICD
jgi:hypothetical protein